MEDDDTLLRNYRSGNPRALEELVEKYQREMYAFAFRMTGDREDAMDVTQKTFMNAVNGLHQYAGKASFRTWLYRIAVNTRLNHLRESRISQDSEPDENLTSDDPGALAALIQKEKRSHLRESLHRLPDRQRTAVVLRVYHSLSMAETAQAMQCSEGAVKAHYHSGVKKLREVMKEKGYEIN